MKMRSHQWLATAPHMAFASRPMAPTMRTFHTIKKFLHAPLELVPGIWIGSETQLNKGDTNMYVVAHVAFTAIIQKPGFESHSNAFIMFGNADDII